MGTDGSTPPVDLEGFRAVMREAGVEEIVEEILDLFLQQAGTTFRDLEAARAGNDIEGMGAAAHSLRSASLNIRATGLGDLLNRLEMTTERGDLAGAIRIFEPPAIVVAVVDPAHHLIPLPVLQVSPPTCPATARWDRGRFPVLLRNFRRHGWNHS